MDDSSIQHILASDMPMYTPVMDGDNVYLPLPAWSADDLTIMLLYYIWVTIRKAFFPSQWMAPSFCMLLPQWY